MSDFHPITANEDKDFSVDWSTQIGDDTISSSDWIIKPAADPTLSDESIDGKTTTAFVSGCVLGVTYTLTNRIVTAAGRTLDRSFALICTPR